MFDGDCVRSHAARRTGRLTKPATTNFALVRHIPSPEKSLSDGDGCLYRAYSKQNTPIEIIDKLNKEINAGLADPKIKARLADLGGTVLPGSAADFGKLIADETEKWAKVVKFSGIKPD